MPIAAHRLDSGAVSALTTFLRPFKDVDRAILDGDEERFVRVDVKKGTDEILGATIVARHAGDLVTASNRARLAAYRHPQLTFDD